MTTSCHHQILINLLYRWMELIWPVIPIGVLLVKHLACCKNTSAIDKFHNSLQLGWPIIHKYLLLFLFGDTVGALPLWYELQDAINTLGPQIFVSSHLLAASSLGFKHLTPVDPGLTVSIDMSSSSTATTTTTTTGTGSRTSPDTGPMSSFEVISSQHWSEGRSKQYAPLRMAEAEHRTIELLESTSRSLPS